MLKEESHGSQVVDFRDNRSTELQRLGRQDNSRIYSKHGKINKRKRVFHYDLTNIVVFSMISRMVLELDKT